jgi:hypothetical protein
MADVFFGQFENGAFSGCDLFGERGEFLIELDVFSEDAGAVFAPALDVFAEGFAAGGDLLELLDQAGQRGAFAAVTFFDTGEIRALDGVLFAEALGFGLSGFQLFSQSFQRQVAFGSFGFLLFGEREIAGAGFVGSLFFALQAIEFEAGDGDSGVGTVDLFGCAAEVVIERDCFLFTRLLELAETFEFG